MAVIERPKTEVWYKKQRLGIHSIDQMMKNIVKSNPVALSGKKLTNHSARKTLVKKLRTANVERQSIIQLIGHASEQSLQDYDEGTEQEQQVLSSIISNNPLQPLKANSDRGTQSQSSNLAQTVNNFQNRTVTFIQGQTSSPCLPSIKRYKRLKLLDSDSESQ